MESYVIFDTPISSEIPLPELRPCPEGKPLIAVSLLASAQFDDRCFTACHVWSREGVPPICTSARRDADYLLTFPGRVRFHIRPGGSISCIPAPGIGPNQVRQLLLNQVIPRYLAHTGELLLHASAVTLPNGRTVAFLGESGFGKSTLASYCYQNGAQVIDDDCLLLRSVGGAAHVIGGVPTIRLHPDSLHALGHNSAAFAPCVEYLDKQQMSLASGPAAGLAPRVLDALFLLGGPGDDPAGNTVRIQPAAGQAAMMAILRSVFSLDPTEPDTMRRTFAQAGRVLTGREGLRVYRLLYPRQHAKLPAVLRAVLDHQRV